MLTASWTRLVAQAQNSALARHFSTTAQDLCSTTRLSRGVPSNNGAYGSFVTYSPGSGTPKELCEFMAFMQPLPTAVLTHMGKGLFLKLPNAFSVNGSFFFRYSFTDNCTIYLASIANSANFDGRLRGVFPSETPDEAPRIRRPDPFIFLSLLFEHFSMQMEDERESMD